jgi:hypothetical protein
MALFSNPFDGSPGVVQNLHSSLLVFTSNAETYPRKGGNSSPALPMNTLAFATRAAIVREYEEISRLSAPESPTKTTGAYQWLRPEPAFVRQ